jgi:hypothetical protein
MKITWYGFAIIATAFMIGLSAQNVQIEPGTGRKRTPEFARSVPTKATLDGFAVSEVRFDESKGTQKPTPVIPKSWRFVGVSRGEGVNSNNLWFQDEDGSIYLVQGFVRYEQFTMLGTLQKINSK